MPPETLVGAPLPGYPPRVLQRAYGALEGDLRAAMREHLLGGTSADRVSGWFRRASAPVGATAIKTYRRALKREGVIV